MKFARGDRVEVNGTCCDGETKARTRGQVLAPMTRGGYVEVDIPSGGDAYSLFFEDELDPVSRVRRVGVFEDELAEHLDGVQEMMVSRHKKYGPGNIAEFGELGLLVRLSDKMARLKNNQEDFSDESVDDTVSDIIGYALIWKMVRAGDWPSQNVAT